MTLQQQQQQQRGDIKNWTCQSGTNAFFPLKWKQDEPQHPRQQKSLFFNPTICERGKHAKSELIAFLSTLSRNLLSGDLNWKMALTQAISVFCDFDYKKSCYNRDLKFIKWDLNIWLQ
jgi:hypothetical protein